MADEEGVPGWTEGSPEEVEAEHEVEAKHETEVTTSGTSVLRLVASLPFATTFTANGVTITKLGTTVPTDQVEAILKTARASGINLEVVS